MKFILGAYSQLPFGSEESCFEEVLTKKLKSILTYLYTEPDKKLLLYLTIAEYEFLEQNHPELNMLIYDLCKKNQIELLTGTYNDVMLPLIPAHERSIQIEKTTTYLRKRFSKKPRGLWCFEQVFSPQLLPLLSLSSLDYLIISSYNQSQDCVIYNKPFVMDEMGKTSIVFPFDDKFSKELADIKNNKSIDEKLALSFQKLASSTRETLPSIMLNLDEMQNVEDPSFVYKKLFQSFGKDCTLCSDYLDDNSVARSGYIPGGVYGRDFVLGKKYSVNQIILENSIQNKYSKINNYFRDICKDLKKNSNQRLKLENSIFKSNTSALFVNDNYKYPEIRKYTNKNISEMESILIDDDSLPSLIDIDGDGSLEHVALSKNNLVFISPKGAVLNRLNFLSCSWDLVNHNSDGLFYDVILNSATGRKVSLGSRKFEVSSLDKRRLDFFAVSSSIDLGTCSANIIKRYKLRQNSVILDIEVENISANSSESYIYESCLNLFLSENAQPVISDKEGTKVVLFDDKKLPFTLTLAFNEACTIESKPVFSNVNDCLGDRQFYQYTQVNIKKKLSLKPTQEDRLSLAMRIEKRKEKR